MFTFAAVVVPAVFQKLPFEAFRLTITRGTDFLDWTMEDLHDVILKELELREDHHYKVPSRARMQEHKNGTKINNTLLTKQETENCAFLLGRHTHENCRKFKDVSLRKSTLVRFGTCFKCLQKGSRARESKSSELCNNCYVFVRNVFQCIGNFS